MAVLRTSHSLDSPTDPAKSGSGPLPGAAPQGASAPRGVCQPEEALRRLGGLPDLYADIVGRLLDDAAGIFARLQSAVETKDLSVAHSSSHSLKGLALMCGAVSVADAARAMEDATRPGGAPAWQPLMARIADEMALARVLLTPYR